MIERGVVVRAVVVGVRYGLGQRAQRPFLRQTTPCVGMLQAAALYLMCVLSYLNVGWMKGRAGRRAGVGANSLIVNA